jgi:hypothetical protein
MTVDPSKPYTTTMAPRVIKGRVVIGNSGNEYGVRGYVSAYDAMTGQLFWPCGSRGCEHRRDDPCQGREVVAGG